MSHTLPMTKREQLIAEIEAFCLTKKLSDRRFSMLATGNVKFVGRLRRGVVTSRSMDLADRFIVANQEVPAETLAERARATDCMEAA